jgi:hypothetical protein
MRFGRGARVVEWDGLENRCGPRGHRGFESHPLRYFIPSAKLKDAAAKEKLQEELIK